MTRTQRLLELLQILRAQRYPVAASTLAERLEISVRTVYRDIKTLQDQGVCIEGSAGMGYVIRSDYHLPPLIFTPEEIHALTLGLNWVGHHTDPAFKDIAKTALAKIHAVMPDHLKKHIEHQSYFTGPSVKNETFFHEIRNAINRNNKVDITYCDKNDIVSSRKIWPIALSCMDSCWLVVGWCELRKGFRHFRTDRIINISIQDATYSESKSILLKRWRMEEGIRLDKEY